MAEVLIVYHTYGDGPVGRLARGIGAGAEEVAGVDVRIQTVADVTDDDLKRADGIAIGSPKMPGHTVSPEIAELIGRLDTLRSELHYKVGTGFSGSHGSFGGQELVIQVILRALLLYNMVVIGQGTPDEEGGSDFVGGVIVEDLDDQTAAWARNLGRRLAQMSLLVAKGAKGD